MQPDRYAVMGNPIAHSKSPRIHTLFAEQTQQNLRYDAILVALDGFAAAVDAFRQAGGKGLNITVPFKQQAWDYVAERSTRAERAGAVNTMLFDAAGRCYGDNTDGVGLVRDLVDNHGITIAGSDILILGAGGAVRGVLGPLLEQGPTKVTIANRTVDRAQELAGAFASSDVTACGYDALGAQSFHVIINGTSASLQGDLPPLPDSVLRCGGCAYDMMYGAQPTPFLTWAAAHGAGNAIDGLGMLVEQAAESFHLWRGVRPQTSSVIESLRKDLGR